MIIKDIHDWSYQAVPHCRQVRTAGHSQLSPPVNRGILYLVDPAGLYGRVVFGLPAAGRFFAAGRLVRHHGEHG